MLATDPDDAIVAEMANAELMSLIRLGRFTECEAVAERGGAAARRTGRPDIAYAIWIHAACALSGAGNLTGALRAAEAAVAAARGITVIELPCLAARAFVLSRLGRHDDALSAAEEQLAKAERMDSPAAAAWARHDAGLISLAAARCADAARLPVLAQPSAADRGTRLGTARRPGRPRTPAARRLGEKPAVDSAACRKPQNWPFCAPRLGPTRHLSRRRFGRSDFLPGSGKADGCGQGVLLPQTGV